MAFLYMFCSSFAPIQVAIIPFTFTRFMNRVFPYFAGGLNHP